MPVRFEKFAASNRFDPVKPWLVIGKGPTLDRISDVDLAAYHTVAMNHVPRAVPGHRFDLLHAIDIEVVTGGSQADGIADLLDVACRFLLMPELPNENMTAGLRTLAAWSAMIEPLGKLDSTGRLIGYHLSPGKIGDAPGQIVAPCFSASAVLCIIGLLGGRRVKTLGIDGGIKYATPFAATHPLENGQPSFDVQFENHRAICEHYGMSYDPLFEPD